LSECVEALGVLETQGAQSQCESFSIVQDVVERMRHNLTFVPASLTLRSFLS